jgi:V/A-type H+-transporting ATPase subunit F
MYKIAVMGDYDSIYGFATLGLAIFATDRKDDDEILRMIRRTADSGFGIIYMTEALMERLGSGLDRYRETVTPAIIAIPGVTGNTGIGVRQVRKSVEQAVGSDILFSDQDKEKEQNS